MPAALPPSTQNTSTPPSARTLLECLEDLLVVKRLGQALHGGQRLAAVALLHADMDGKALRRVLGRLARLLLGGGGRSGLACVSEWICRSGRKVMRRAG